MYLANRLKLGNQIVGAVSWQSWLTPDVPSMVPLCTMWAQSVFKCRIQKLSKTQFFQMALLQEILDLLKTCLEQNYFEFNGSLYSSSEGLIMGNPLSPLLAKTFMDSLEREISIHPIFKKFIYWYRYVDDIVTKVTDSKLNSFFSLATIKN